MDGRLLSDRLGKACLPKNLAPGEAATLDLTLRLPDNLAPGSYRLQFDLVDELVCWFSDASQDTPATRPVIVE